jgi:hypothetical protein
VEDLKLNQLRVVLFAVVNPFRVYQQLRKSKEQDGNASAHKPVKQISVRVENGNDDEGPNRVRQHRP